MMILAGRPEGVHMGVAWLGLALIAFQAPKPTSPPATAADLVTLRDGGVVAGQIVNPNQQGKLVMMVRRAWAREHLPERLKTWEAAEGRDAGRARTERLRRLEDWRRDRDREGDADPLLRRIDAAVERLKAGGDAASRLLPVAIDRREIVKIDRRTPDLARLVRLGWRAGFDDVEAMAPDDLRGALEGRNMPVAGNDPAPVDDLLPEATESEMRWRLRRAATEIAADRSAWFVRYGDALMADSGDGAQKLDPAAMLGGLGNLTGLMRELTGEAPPPDPLPPKLKALAERGRVGAVVTKLEIAPDLASVTVEAEMWVNVGPGPEAWQAAGKRSATVRTDEVGANAGAAIEADPRVKSAFSIVEGLGLGEITPEMKSRALGVGAATQQALSRVREQANADLEELSVDLER